MKFIDLHKLLLALVLLGGKTLSAQKNEIVQQRIEFISEQLQEENIDLSDLVEALYYYFEHPINLNKTTKQELSTLLLLSEIQIDQLFKHIANTGPLNNLVELQAIPHWDQETIDILLPFVHVHALSPSKTQTWEQVLKNAKFESFMRYQRILEHRPAYDQVSTEVKQQSNSYYHGSPDRLYTRLRYTSANVFSVGFSGEKDPGEEFFRGSQKQGFDFYSLHLFYSPGKLIDKVIIGDYQVQIGQGLNLWTGYAFGKTADVSLLKKSAQSIKPYTSVDEVRFLRGAAIDMKHKHFSLLVFASRKKIGANISIDSLSAEQAFATSINITGLHRTSSEIANKNAMTELLAGTNLRYSRSNLHLGLAAVHQQYSSLFDRAPNNYNLFDFRGRQTTGLSADYNYVWRNCNFFGEIAYSTFTQSFATLSGATIALDYRATLSILYRNYSPGYYSFYNNGFAEGSRTQNEKGIYFGLQVKLTPTWTVNSYLDLFQHDWIKYLVNAPSHGNEFLIQSSYKPNKITHMYVRFRQQVRPRNILTIQAQGNIPHPEDQTQRNYRIHFSHQINLALSIKSRIEFMTFESVSRGRETGLLIQQDLVYKSKTLPIDIQARYALFDTDSYNTRLYSFEANAMNVFAMPSYYYQGSRAYLMVKYTFLRKFDLWLRYGAFIYTNVQSIGTGRDRIDGNRKSDITVQLRIKL